MKIHVIAILILSQNLLAIFSSDTISPNKTLEDNRQTLVSAGDTFELGFFSPPNSDKRYVGIWFKNVPDFTVVWVANRDSPLTGSSPSGHSLKITETGNILIISNDSVSQVWSSNSSAKNPTLRLLDSGNLVVREGSDGENHAWESFDYPFDSLLAGMKIGWNLKTRKQWRLSSWNGTDDPSSGKYTYEIDRVFPQLVQRKGSEIQFRSGPWDGVQFGGDFPLTGNQVFYPVFVFNDTYIYYTFESSDNSTVTRFWMTPLGTIEQLRWSRDSDRWVTIFEAQKDDCDTFARCGPNGFCSFSTSHNCGCPEGFEPLDPEAWHGYDYLAGCALRTRLSCNTSIGFRKFSGLKLPYSLNFTVDPAVKKREECEQICRRNCSCTAYAIVGVNGCVVWFGQLLDVRTYDGRGGDLFVKMASSELGSDDDRKRTAVIISVSVVSGFILILFSMGLYVNRKRNSRSHTGQEETTKHSDEDDDAVLLEEDIELPLFGLHAISNATNFFSSANKIGEGGFGRVYKGILPTGQEIAVKRLSKDSGQGLEEFKNEVILISKLQHRNLVKLLGCCIHKADRMLIYEYMSNKSLDLYIFNQSRGTSLDWPKRFGIIVGIARGLLYLHRDSRLRIIHRDLKASNILLDTEMNPKISDFGLARIFGGDQNEVNTKRVVGTYGYMSPEYAIDGHFSVKSDVFSFGVMVLEIVSGKKNRGFEHQDHDLNLLGHAWKLWNDGRPMALVDDLMENVSVSEVMKCIQTGLLCVQKRPEERPLVSSVLYMLDCTDHASLPQPKQPGFYIERAFTETDSSSSLNNHLNVSTEMSVTNFHGR